MKVLDADGVMKIYSTFTKESLGEAILSENQEGIDDPDEIKAIVDGGVLYGTEENTYDAYSEVYKKFGNTSYTSHHSGVTPGKNIIVAYHLAHA